MIDQLDILKNILSKSIEKNGKELPLTLGHLYNLINLSQRAYSKMIDDHERVLSDAEQDAMHDYPDSDF